MQMFKVYCEGSIGMRRLKAEQGLAVAIGRRGHSIVLDFVRGACLRAYAGLVKPLVAAGYRVVLMDCPGWGKSDPIVNTGSRSELNARALKGLMDAIGLDKAYLIGNSMGAHSAVAFALCISLACGCRPLRPMR